MKSVISLWLFLLILNSGFAEKADKVTSKPTVTKKPTTQSTTQKVNATYTSTTQKPAFNIRRRCVCAGGECGCCTGFFLETFRQKACMNLTYEPEEFAITAAFNLNGRNLYKNTISGKNPSPFCVSPPNFRFIKLCVQFSNIYFANRNVHVCTAMQANWQSFTLLSFSFDCLRFGMNGVAVVGAEEGGGVPAGNPLDEEDQTDEDYDDSARHIPLNIAHKLEGQDFDLDQEINNLPLPDNLPFSIQRLINGDVLIRSRKGFSP